MMTIMMTMRSSRQLPCHKVARHPLSLQFSEPLQLPPARLDHQSPTP